MGDLDAGLFATICGKVRLECVSELGADIVADGQEVPNRLEGKDMRLLICSNLSSHCVTCCVVDVVSVFVFVVMVLVIGRK